MRHRDCMLPESFRNGHQEISDEVTRGMRLLVEQGACSLVIRWPGWAPPSTRT